MTTLTLAAVRHVEEREALPRMRSLADLVERLQRGDQSALEELIRATEGLGFQLAWSLLGDRHKCEDVLQDAYLAVHSSIAQLRDVTLFKSWFCKIVVNRCRRVLRERPTESLDRLLEGGWTPSTAEMAERVQDRLEVGEALAGLPVSDREILNLREVLEMSYQEIADTLEIPLGTVRSRLSAARLRLMAAFRGAK